ncbi:hypothetical protein BAE44_0021159 [Dichanthelium oligosanthes]|uniref:Uncharacterized protein n=1 Tax=Dichanthelium oligosanthes TaxID=888268 RepID=A0A1E5UY75_9POAL|nr:hypothetical protein BAE44_0021159 [Dichanthelium oligosanthes]
MENGGGGGGAKPTTRFSFSWADEVEREEQEQVTMQQQQPRREAKREQVKADPFGAARPREVVLAEKGIDWRARDRELDLGVAVAPRPPRRPARGHRHAAATAEAASGRASGISASACRARSARGVSLDQDAGWTPHLRRQAAAAASTPRPTGRGNATSVSRSARGGSKRKFAGEGTVRRARPDGDHAEQGRRVFGELNIGEGGGSSFCDSAAGNGCNCNPGGSQIEVMKAAGAAAADGAPSATVTAIGFYESAASQKKRRGSKRRKGRGLGKTKKQQTQVV